MAGRVLKGVEKAFDAVPVLRGIDLDIAIDMPPKHARPRIGDAVGVRLQPSRIHLFGAGTDGRRLH